MLKGLDGVETHEHREWIPILANDQDMTRLAGRLREALESHPAAHAVLLAGHGMYTWGKSVDEAAAAWKMPAKYKGYAEPAPERLKNNIRLAYMETK